MIVLQPRRLEAELQTELAPTVSVFVADGIAFDEGATVVSRFLSRLAWSLEGGVEELFSVGSNLPDRPGRLGLGSYRRSGWIQCKPTFDRKGNR